MKLSQQSSFDDQDEIGKDIWKDVDSDHDDIEEEEENENQEISNNDQNKVLYIIDFNPLFYKKNRKIVSLFLILFFISLLAYLDYVNDFQIKNLISNFHIIKSCSSNYPTLFDSDISAKQSVGFGFVSSLPVESMDHHHDDIEMDIHRTKVKILQNMVGKVVSFVKRHIVKQ